MRNPYPSGRGSTPGRERHGPPRPRPQVRPRDAGPPPVAGARALPPRQGDPLEVRDEGRGRRGIVEWKKTRQVEGPPYRIRLSPAQATKVLRAAGFEAQEPFEAGRYHYGISATPRTR